MHGLLFAPSSIGVGLGLGFGLTNAWSASRHRRLSWLKEFWRRVGPVGGETSFRSVIPDTLGWTRNQVHQEHVTFFMKPLHHDPQTGHVLLLVRYPAGSINPGHRHRVGHGMYVLQGQLVTHQGTFERGAFVWFPPHETMMHGAGPDEELVAIFMTDASLDTRYVSTAPG